MRALFLFLILWSLLSLNANASTWQKGCLVLKNGTVLTGHFSVEVRYDIVVYKSSGGNHVFTSHQVQSIRLYDSLANIHHKYFSMEIFHHNYSSHHLVEVVVEGEIRLVRRPSLLITSKPSELDFVYFFALNGEIIPLQKFRKKVFPKLEVEMGLPLQDFIASNKLNINQSDDAIRIIQFYNAHWMETNSVVMN